MQLTKWSPDTCSCIIIYEWDKDLEPPERTHIIKEIVHACEAHEILSDPDIWTYVFRENTRKNISIDEICTYLETDYQKLLEQFQFTWRFEGEGDSRILYVSLPTLGPQQKIIAQRRIDDVVGEGLAVVE